MASHHFLSGDVEPHPPTQNDNTAAVWNERATEHTLLVNTCTATNLLQMRRNKLLLYVSDFWVEQFREVVVTH